MCQGKVVISAAEGRHPAAVQVRSCRSPIDIRGNASLIACFSHIVEGLSRAQTCQLYEDSPAGHAHHGHTAACFHPIRCMFETTVELRLPLACSGQGVARRRLSAFPCLLRSGACHLVFLPCMQHKGTSGGDGLDPGISEGPRGTSGVAAGAMPEMPPEAQPDSLEPPFQRPPMWHPQVSMPAVTHCRPLRMLQCQNMKRITCNLPHAS